MFSCSRGIDCKFMQKLTLPAFCMRTATSAPAPGGGDEFRSRPTGRGAPHGGWVQRARSNVPDGDNPPANVIPQISGSGGRQCPFGAMRNLPAERPAGTVSADEAAPQPGRHRCTILYYERKIMNASWAQPSALSSRSTGDADRQQTPYRCHKRNHGL